MNSIEELALEVLGKMPVEPTDPCVGDGYDVIPGSIPTDQVHEVARQLAEIIMSNEIPVHGEEWVIIIQDSFPSQTSNEEMDANWPTIEGDVICFCEE